MSDLRRDYSTRSTSLREIKDIADQTRNQLVGNSRPNFDVVDAAQRLASKENIRWGKLNIVLHSVPDGEPFAKVLIKPNRKTLVIDPELWADAKIGEPKSRFIVAHELGHIILHDQHVQPFSDEKNTVFQKEKSTEWQANRFAEFFLLADEFLFETLTVFQAAAICGVEMPVLRSRLGTKLARCGSICPQCGDSRVSVGKKFYRCDMCGEEFI